jgi:hypothetical protein
MIAALMASVAIAIIVFPPFEHAEWAGFALFSAAALSFQRGRRCGLMDAFDLIQQDSRRPIVYIRSFSDEYKLNKLVSQQAGLLPLIFSATLEEQLAVAMSEI